MASDEAIDEETKDSADRITHPSMDITQGPADVETIHPFAHEGAVQLPVSSATRMGFEVGAGTPSGPGSRVIANVVNCALFPWVAS